MFLYSEELIVDNSVHSDLDPLEAPEWSISIAMQVRLIICLISVDSGNIYILIFLFLEKT